MPELSDEEFFAILGVAPKHERLDDHLTVSPEVSDMPALVNADGTRYLARRNAPNLLQAVLPSKPQPPVNQSAT